MFAKIRISTYEWNITSVRITVISNNWKHSIPECIYVFDIKQNSTWNLSTNFTMSDIIAISVGIQIKRARKNGGYPTGLKIRLLLKFNFSSATFPKNVVSFEMTIHRNFRIRNSILNNCAIEGYVLETKSWNSKCNCLFHVVVIGLQTIDLNYSFTHAEIFPLFNCIVSIF